MKTKTLLMIGAAGAALAYFFLLRKKSMSAPAPADVPVDTQDAIEPPVVDPALQTGGYMPPRKDNEVTLNNLFQGRTGGYNPPMAPNRLSAYSQTFTNRVFTIVKQRHGDKANTGLYPDSKRLSLYERVWQQLLNQGVQNPMQASLGQINVAVGKVGEIGFAFPH